MEDSQKLLPIIELSFGYIDLREVQFIEFKNDYIKDNPELTFYIFIKGREKPLTINKNSSIIYFHHPHKVAEDYQKLVKEFQQYNNN